MHSFWGCFWKRMVPLHVKGLHLWNIGLNNPHLLSPTWMKVTTVWVPHHFYWWKRLELQAFLASRIDYNRDCVSMQRWHGCVCSQRSFRFMDGVDLRYRFMSHLLLNICNSSCLISVLWTRTSLSVLILRSDPYLGHRHSDIFLEYGAIFINLLFITIIRPPNCLPHENLVPPIYCICIYITRMRIFFALPHSKNQLSPPLGAGKPLLRMHNLQNKVSSFMGL